MSEQSKQQHYIVKDYGDSINEQLNAKFGVAIQKTFPSLDVKVQVKESNHAKHGDYQFDKCMQMARQLGAFQSKNNNENEGGGTNKLFDATNELANKIVASIEPCDLVEKYEVVNGFINIFLSNAYLGRKIAKICVKGSSVPKIAKKHVVVDYSSPNIAKQMHVGHLRSTIIGESICRLLEMVGFSVLRLNHIGDWGTQFGMLIAFLREQYPNYLDEPPALHDLQSFYKASKVKFDNDVDFKACALKCVVQLQNREPEIVKAWELICAISRKDYEQIYKRLDIKFGTSDGLVERGESFYQSRMEALIPELQKAKVLTMEEGRQLFFVEGFAVPMTLVKSDGGFTYATSDMAALKQRLTEEGADWILYVVDKGQSEHLETVYAAGRQLAWYNPSEKRVEHVQFGLILGEDKKKLKSRSGNTIKLHELLDEGVSRAKEKLRARDFLTDELTEASEALAYGCIKYSDLAQSRISDYAFSYDRMLEDRGNTAVYLLYAYTRIRSIARNAQIGREQIVAYVTNLKDGALPLEHPKEIRLAKQILKFADCLLYMLDTLQVNKACEYVYELATMYSDFYNECQVVQKVQQKANGEDETIVVDFNRLALCEVTGDVMLRCFHILGIRPIERM